MEFAYAKRLIMAEGFLPGPPTPDDIASDWAVIALGSAVSTAAAVRAFIRRASGLMGGCDIYRYFCSSERHFSRSRAQNTIAEARCRLFGAPLLAQMNDKIWVVGINSAGNPLARLGMACSSKQFAKAVSELQKLEIRD